MLTLAPEKQRFSAYVQLLGQLHDLIAADQGDSERADILRDELLEHLPHLDQRRYRLGEGLTEDLYTLVEDQPPTAPTMADESRSHVEVLEDLSRAWGTDWQRVLDLLREGAAYIKLDHASYARFRCWWELGELEIALRFIIRAAELAPQNANYRMLALETLRRLERFEEAVNMAEWCLAHTREPRLHLKAAEVIFSTAAIRDEATAGPLYQRVVSIINSTLENSPKFPAEESLRSMSVAAYVILGLSREALGETSAAVSAIDQAIALDSECDTALVARGLLRWSTDPTEARVDFEQAIAADTPLVWPYYFLALQRIGQDDFEACQPLCRAALQRTLHPNLRADLLEWLAIAEMETGGSTEAAERLFSEAASLAPFNPRFAWIQRFPGEGHPSAWRIEADLSAKAAMWQLRQAFHTTRLAQSATAELGQLVV